MRKLSAIFLLLVFAASANSLWILDQLNYLQMKAKVKEFIRSKANENNLDQLSFSNAVFATLHFEDEGQEVEFNGRMYDIVRIQSLPGKKIIYCFSDEKESALKDLAAKNNAAENKTLGNLVAKIFVPCFSFPAVLFKYPAQKKIQSFSPPQNEVAISYDVVTPPPKLG